MKNSVFFSGGMLCNVSFLLSGSSVVQYSKTLIQTFFKDIFALSEVYMYVCVVHVLVEYLISLFGWVDGYLAHDGNSGC